MTQPTGSDVPTLRHRTFSSSKLGQALKSFQRGNCTMPVAGFISVLWVRRAQAAPLNPAVPSPHPALPKHFVSTLAEPMQLN